MDYDNLPDLSSTALLMMLKVDKSRFYAIKEMIYDVASKLQEDDIGYYYDEKQPNQICTHLGSLVGYIANTKFKEVDIIKAISQTYKIAKAIDNNYKKVIIIIIDEINSKNIGRFINYINKMSSFNTFVFDLTDNNNLSEIIDASKVNYIKTKLINMSTEFSKIQKHL